MNSELARQRQANPEAHPRPTWCICDDAFWFRALDDPACRHDDLEDPHDEVDRLSVAIYAMDKRIKAGGPANYLDLAERYMPADVAEAVRAVLEAG